MLLIVFMYFIFALTFPLGKLALAYVDSPLFFVAFRMVIAGTGLLVLQYLRNRDVTTLVRSEWKRLIAISLTAFFIAFSLEFWALEALESIKVNLIYSLAPFITALLAFFCYKERLTGKKVLGLVMGFLGLLLLFSSGGSEEGNHLSGALSSISYRELALLISVISSSYSWFLVRDLMKKGYDLLTINGYSMLLAGIVSWVTYGGMWGGVGDTGSLLFFVVALILLSNVLGFTLYGHLIVRYSPTFISFAGFLCPFFGAGLGYVLLGEVVTHSYALAFGAVVGGLLLFYLSESSSR